MEHEVVPRLVERMQPAGALVRWRAAVIRSRVLYLRRIVAGAL